MSFKKQTNTQFILLFICGLGCGGTESEPESSVGIPSVEQPAEENPPEIVAPAVPEGRLRLDDPGALLVLAEMNELYYQAFEIAERPYNGKRMEYHPGGIEKKETLFVDGALNRMG
jgi:hypothetical protein